jgi:hypothetical protein
VGDAAVRNSSPTSPQPSLWSVLSQNMSDTPQTLLGTETPVATHHEHHHSHLQGHTGKRVRKMLHLPDGRKVHVAHSPDEANHLRKALNESSEKDDFNLVIHGSPEHVSLRVLFSLEAEMFRWS